MVFRSFVDMYDLDYGTQEEFNYRLGVFYDNLRYINWIKNENASGPEYGLNQFTAMTSEEFQQILVPVTFDLAKFNDEIPKINFGEFFRKKRENPPESFDYRDYGWVSPVKDQKSCGGSWAFVSSALLESINLRYYQVLLDTSEQWLIDCNPRNSGCQGGWLDYGIDFIQKYGIPPESEYPYTGTDSNNTCSNSCGIYHKNIIYTLIESETDIEYCIYNYGPVGFFFKVPKAFQFYTGGTFDVENCDQDVSGLHEATVVGYTPEYWIVKNSWGEYWGDNGYVYYKKNKNLCGIEKQLIATYKL